MAPIDQFESEIFVGLWLSKENSIQCHKMLKVHGTCSYNVRYCKHAHIPITQGVSVPEKS